MDPISIHAPRKGSDLLIQSQQFASHVFQSTPPARGATLTPCELLTTRATFQSTPPARGATFEAEWQDSKTEDISIHAPRKGSDSLRSCRRPNLIHFNPRPPQGERPLRSSHLYRHTLISIHAPRKGSDVIIRLPVIALRTFQSTPPARGATSSVEAC